MGMFDFLKKDKLNSLDNTMDLPPIPKLEGFGDEFMQQNNTPTPIPELTLPQTTQPQYNNNTPTQIKIPNAPKPQQTVIITRDENNISNIYEQTPEQPTIQQSEPEIVSTTSKIPNMEQFPAPEFPEIPQLPTEEFIPERIPPLEGIPEAPEFDTNSPTTQIKEMPFTSETIFEPEYSSQKYIEEKPLFRKKEFIGPVFIRTDNFRNIIEDIETVRAKFKEEDDLFFRATEIKNTQDQRFETFRQNLEDVQRKLIFIDRALFELNG